MKHFKIALAFCAAALVGCGSTTGDFHTLTDLTIDAPAAPDVHGANGYMEPGKHAIRLSNKIHMGDDQREKLERLENKQEQCYGSSLCQHKNEVGKDGVAATYNITRPFLDFSAQWLHKIDPIVISAGLSYNDGPYTFVTFGFNTKHLEAGVSLGYWVYGRNQYFKGLDVSYEYSYHTGSYSYQSNDFEDHSKEYTGIMTGGGYISLYYNPVFFTYSMNAYNPNFSEEWDYDDIYFDLPYVLTSYFTAGYRLDERWEISGGLSNVYGEFAGWHWAGHAGISFYAL